MKGFIVGIVVVFLIFMMGGCVAIGIRNSLVTKEEIVAQKWSEIENQLQRRYDLIPNLVSTVKGYAKHEEAVFKSVSDARSAMFAAKGVNGKAEAEANMNNALSRLLAVAENYPNLKADQQFARLSDELAGTENRVAVARKRYNDSVMDFNGSIKRFPGCLFGFSKKDYFNPPDKGKIEKAPKVEF